MRKGCGSVCEQVSVAPPGCGGGGGVADWSVVSSDGQVRATMHSAPSVDVAADSRDHFSAQRG